MFRHSVPKFCMVSFFAALHSYLNQSIINGFLAREAMSYQTSEDSLDTFSISYNCWDYCWIENLRC